MSNLLSQLRLEYTKAQYHWAKLRRNQEKYTIEELDASEDNMNKCFRTYQKYILDGSGKRNPTKVQ